MYWVLNATEIDGKPYNLETKIKKMHHLADIGLDNSFYGGRIGSVAEAEDGVFMLIENRGEPQVIDLMVFDLDVLPNKTLREMCELRKIKIYNTTRRTELIRQLGGEPPEEKTEEAL